MPDTGAGKISSDICERILDKHGSQVLTFPKVLRVFTKHQEKAKEDSSTKLITPALYTSEEWWQIQTRLWQDDPACPEHIISANQQMPDPGLRDVSGHFAAVFPFLLLPERSVTWRSPCDHRSDCVCKSLFRFPRVKLFQVGDHKA